MDVTQIATVTTDVRLVDALRGSGLKIQQIDAAQFGAYARASEGPAAVVLDVRPDHQLPAALAAFRRQHPDAGIVLVVATLDPKVMLEAMRAGVNECVAEPITPQALEDAVRRVLVGHEPEPAGQVFAFVGAKGGVGTTTVAVNTAASLARVTKAPALLVDLHLRDGDTALFLAAEPRFSILDALENVHRVDESFFSGLVEKTKVGVHLLASATRPVHGAIDPARPRTLLEFAARKYRCTVLDVPRSDLSMLDALDPATVIVVVTNQEVCALRSAARTADMLRQRYGPQRVRVVANRFDSDAVIGRAEIDRAVGSAVKHLIPSDYRTAIEAVNAGKPIVLDKQGKLSQAFVAFARDLAGVPKEKEPRAEGMLGRLVWRRA